jgi:glycosyltransferase
LKISVITAVYNNESHIEAAINSVLSQTYKNIEYIIIDGASTDGTCDIIKKYEDKIDKFISEPDKGIYDALNKGISLATGDAVGFLHSDDLYNNNNVLELIADKFKETSADSIYGNLVYVDKEDTEKIVRFWDSGEFNFKKLKRGWMVPHPTFYVKREVYNKYGAFDCSFRIAADYDSILRFLGKEQISTAYIPEVLIKMRLGGISNKYSRLLKKSREDLKAMKKNNIGGIYSLIYKNVSKVPQFFKHKNEL